MTTPTVPQDTINIVNPIAQKYGVPTQLWETIAEVESGFNPQAVGDNNTSYGLFQLHIGGQLPAVYNNNPKAVFNPALNAQLAMPSIASAWNQLKGQTGAPVPTTGGFPSGGSASWWQQFAALSGHPGGSPGQNVTNAEATKLQSEWGSLNSNPIVGTTTPTASSSGTTATVGSNPLDIVGTVTGAGSKIGIFVLAFIVVIVGFIVIATGHKK